MATTKYECINSRYGNDMTPVTFAELQAQFADVFPGIEISLDGDNIVDDDGEIVARLCEPASSRRVAATKDELRAALDRLTDLYYCASSETLGLGQCRCNSHGYFGRRDGAEITAADSAAFWGAVDLADLEASRLADALEAMRQPGATYGHVRER